MVKNYNSFPNNADKGDELDIPWFVNENHKGSNAEADDPSDLDEKIIRMVNTNAHKKRQEAEELRARQQRRAEARQARAEAERRKWKNRVRSAIGGVALFAVIAGSTAGAVSFVREDLMQPVAKPSDERIEVTSQGYWDSIVEIANEYNEDHPGYFDGNLDPQKVRHDIIMLNKDKFDPDGDGVNDPLPKGTQLVKPEYGDELGWQ